MRMIPHNQFRHLIGLFEIHSLRRKGHLLSTYYMPSIIIGTQQRGQWHPTLELLSGKSHGQRSLAGCSPWGLEESDTTERLHFHFSLSCIGEGNGNPFQCSCLENPRDGGAWWAAVYGVTQSWTRVKRLSSSSSSAQTLLCPTLCDPMDCSPPGSSVHGTSQARMLERVAISHARESSNTSIKPTAPKPPALAGAPFTTEPPGKPLGCLALFLLRPRSPVTCWVQSWFSYCSDILRTSKQVMTWPLCALPPKCLPCQRGHDVIHAHQK